MKIISHRANLNGSDLKRENQQWAIDECISLGFDVEIDLWLQDNKLYLGHDKPETNISKYFLFAISDFAWIHAKNFEAVSWLNSNQNYNLNWFWHESDKMTLTSKKIPWCYPNNYIETGVTVVLEQKLIPVNVYGVCTDYPQIWNK
jgi:hypothetical protein